MLMKKLAGKHWTLEHTVKGVVDFKASVANLFVWRQSLFGNIVHDLEIEI